LYRERDTRERVNEAGELRRETRTCNESSSRNVFSLRPVHVKDRRASFDEGKSHHDDDFEVEFE
jgi:hypothetical protein